MKTRLFLLTTMSMLSALFGTANAGEGEKVSYPAPVVSGINQDGATVNFADVYKKGPTVVFFYPKADTPGCTKQACNLRDAFEEVTKAGIKVFGVSADTAEDQEAFAEKFTLPFTLLADKKGEVIAAFGVPTINDKGLAARQSFLIKDGKVIWRDLKAKPTTQAEDAIAAAKANG